MALMTTLLRCHRDAGMTLSYLNMLVVMSFNPGLMMAVVTGEAVGTFAFEPFSESAEHCAH